MSDAVVTAQGEAGGADNAALGIRAILERQARRFGGAPLITLPDGTLSYAAVDNLADRTAEVLAGLGVVAGDVVMVLCQNSRAMVAGWFGCAKLGAVFMPVNALLSGTPLAAVAGHAAARVAICEAALLGVLDEVRAELPSLRCVLVAGGRPPAWAQSLDGLLDEASGAAPPPLSASDPAAPAKLMYTSGTTGNPKGVVWSRTCEAVWARNYGDELFETAEGETAYTCLPLFHITAQGTTLASLWRGGHVVIDAGFDPLRFWRRIRESRAVVLTFVGTILSVLARRPPRADDADNHVRRIVGAAAPADRWRDVEQRFELEILETWGQTETASCWMFPRSLPSTPGRVGVPSSRWDARYADEHGDDVAVGSPGELWMRPRTPHVMFEGYLREGGGVASPYDAQGWYHTGDLLVRHPEGDHAFAGRLREAIRRRGEMISAATIEEAALSEAGVAQAAAVGVPAADGVEEEVKLCVVTDAANAVGIDPRALHAALRRRLPRHMVPRYIAVLDALPLTPTTRVRRVLLSDAGVAGAWDARRNAAAPRELAQEQGQELVG